jgi:hypothetical protein
VTCGTRPTGAASRHTKAAVLLAASCGVEPAVVAPPKRAAVGEPALLAVACVAHKPTGAASPEPAGGSVREQVPTDKGTQSRCERKSKEDEDGLEIVDGLIKCDMAQYDPI